ncbi:MAG: nucleoside-diphosphate kinase [Neisseriales bacterium]|nr:MAG: nucleoside-diphosphate kinase [Neisseriales bacterium]
MVQERTLSLIKPNAVDAQHIGEIIHRFESNQLRIIGMKMCQLSQQKAEGFYAIHRHKPFFRHLIDFIISGPIVLLVLEGEDAIAKNRRLMGHVDPVLAEPQTIRKDFGQTITANGIHGSDCVSNAALEIRYFFAETELYPHSLSS